MGWLGSKVSPTEARKLYAVGDLSAVTETNYYSRHNMDRSYVSRWEYAVGGCDAQLWF
jgi:hypothetical protein